MPNGAVTWAALVSGVSALVAIVTFWFKVFARIETAVSSAEAAKTRADSANALAGGAIAKIEIVAAHLSEYREQMAARTATLETLIETNGDSMTKLELRLLSGLRDIADETKAMNKRLDRLIDRDRGD